jgi:hypothetical protein
LNHIILSHLSGGEKVLTVEALILSLHLQTESLVHAIDECTQRLDIKCKAQAFAMVHHAVTEIARLSQGRLRRSSFCSLPIRWVSNFLPKRSSSSNRSCSLPRMSRKAKINAFV